MSKTKVILKSKDGRTYEAVFDTYPEACDWVAARAAKREMENEPK